MEFTKTASPQVRQALEAASDPNHLLGFNQFVEIALYHPEFGYYQSDRQRVARHSDADFFTASSLKKAFGPILLEASIGLLESSGFDPSSVTWVEIGSEPDSALLHGVDHPFNAVRSIGLNEPISLEGDLVVFSNELFDAQPFHSVVFRGDRWLERAIEVDEPGLRIIEKPPFSTGIQALIDALPNPAPQGYIVDLPSGAKTLADSIATQPWKGAFIAFDYGKTWKALTHDFPQGTARAYRRHQQKTDLLEKIGQQDITCHICWDWMEDALKNSGFQSVVLESQEAFVLKRATALVRRIFESGSGLDDPLKGTLRQLIHPSLMGQKFQSITGVRTANQKQR